MQDKFCKFCNCKHPVTKEFWYFKGIKPDTCKEYKRVYRKEYYKSNKDKLNKINKEWAKKNKEKDRKRAAKYYQDNKESIRERRREVYREYERNRRKSDIQFKLRKNLRSRLRIAIIGNYKTGSAVKDLGCSIEYFKEYLESMFTAEMNWDNYGIYWSIDHVRPLSTFNLTDKEQFKQACHYLNLQPLTVSQNSKKGNTYTVPFSSDTNSKSGNIGERCEEITPVDNQSTANTEITIEVKESIAS